MVDFIVSSLSFLAPPIAIIAFAFIVLFIIQLCYKFFMDQNKVKKNKEEIKELNKEWKQAQKNKETGKAKELMSQIMEKNNKTMMMSFKPMMISMLLVILILPGLHQAYGNIEVPFDDTGILTANNVTIHDTVHDIQLNGDKLTVSGQEFTVPSNQIRIDGYIFNINTHEEECFLITCTQAGLRLERVVALFPVNLPFAGNDAGWLLWYFLVSIPIMQIIKKLLKVYM